MEVSMEWLKTTVGGASETMLSDFNGADEGKKYPIRVQIRFLACANFGGNPNGILLRLFQLRGQVSVLDAGATDADPALPLLHMVEDPIIWGREQPDTLLPPRLHIVPGIFEGKGARSNFAG